MVSVRLPFYSVKEFIPMDCRFFAVAYFTLIFTIEITAGTKSYCSLCPVPGTHTMCKFPNKGPGPKCQGYRAMPLTFIEELEILELHNALRDDVALGRVNLGRPGPQPPATNMRQLSWNNELAEIAQRWADQCTEIRSYDQHDECRDTEEFPVGQNIAMLGSTSIMEQNVSKFVMMWYGEVHDYNKNEVKQHKGSSATGHYTQLVWAKTYLLGCARVVFREQAKTQWLYQRLICNYGPAGNYLKQPVYMIGKPCSACSNGTRCSPLYKGLCSTEKQIESDMTIMQKSYDLMYNPCNPLLLTMYTILCKF